MQFLNSMLVGIVYLQIYIGIYVYKYIYICVTTNDDNLRNNMLLIKTYHLLVIKILSTNLL